jgi:hypothetical protein
MQTNMDQNPTVAVSVSVTVVVVGREGVAVIGILSLLALMIVRGRPSSTRRWLTVIWLLKIVVHPKKRGWQDILWDLTGPLKLPELWDYVSPAAKGKSEFQTAGLTFKKMPF